MILRLISTEGANPSFSLLLRPFRKPLFVLVGLVANSHMGLDPSLDLASTPHMGFVVVLLASPQCPSLPHGQSIFHRPFPVLVLKSVVVFGVS